MLIIINSTNVRLHALFSKNRYFPFGRYGEGPATTQVYEGTYNTISLRVQTNTLQILSKYAPMELRNPILFLPFKVPLISSHHGIK